MDPHAFPAANPSILSHPTDEVQCRLSFDVDHDSRAPIINSSYRDTARERCVNLRKNIMLMIAREKRAAEEHLTLLQQYTDVITNVFDGRTTATMRDAYDLASKLSTTLRMLTYDHEHMQRYMQDLGDTEQYLSDNNLTNAAVNDIPQSDISTYLLNEIMSPDDS